MTTESDLKALFSPPRFKVLGFLSQVEVTDYPTIEEFTGLSVPEISRVVGYLQEHGLAHATKEAKGRYTVTMVAASDLGRKRFRELWRELKKYGADA